MTAALNTHLTIRLTEMGSKNEVTVSYKPSEFQATTYGAHSKSLASVLSLGTVMCPLHNTLSRLNTLLTSQVNIHDHLVSRGLSPKAELVDKKLTVSKLLNSLPYQKMSQVINMLISTFVKETDFYDFSLGMLKVVSNKIKTELDGDFVKIKRRINDAWSAHVTIESVEGYSYHSKISSFSFKDHYGFKICDVGGVDEVTNKISEMFSSSIKPYTDIYMEKIIGESFRTIQTHYETSHGIHSQIEKLAWELFTESGTKRHPVSSIYTHFDELVTMFRENFVDTSLFSLPAPFAYPKRQITAAVSASDEVLSSSSKFNYKDFSTYHNTHHYNFLELIKKGLPLPHFMTEVEISLSIARTKRYFSVFRLGEATIATVLEQKNTLTTFESIVVALESSVNSLIDAVCLLYNEDSELSF